MRSEDARKLLWVMLGLASVRGLQAATAAPPSCRTAVVEGQVLAGQPFRKAFGGGLELVLQPIHSGWILRVLPAGTPDGAIGIRGSHDYAELATPPYESITPLSLSTDFAFRSQDAIGWNPRRFRYATDAASYGRLKAAYDAFERELPSPGAVAQRALAGEVARAADGIFYVVDSRLVPGAADQWTAAGAVSENFTTTAHTLDLPKEGEATPLGRLEMIRFRVELELPAGLRLVPGVKILPHLCGTR